MVLAVLVALLSGCGLLSRQPESAAVTPAPIHEPARKSALARAADQLLEADRAFAAKSLELGAPEAFFQFLDERGMQLSATGEPVVGRADIRERLKSGPPLILSWEPRYAEVFKPGDWGWTWGDWQAHEPGAGGRRLAQGRYVNLWKKQSDGSWKVHMDMGSVAATP